MLLGLDIPLLLGQELGLFSGAKKTCPSYPLPCEIPFLEILRQVYGPHLVTLPATNGWNTQKDALEKVTGPFKHGNCWRYLRKISGVYT